MSTCTLPPFSNQEFVQPNLLLKSDLEYKTQEAEVRGVTFPAFQAVKKHYITAIDYRSYRFVSRSPLFDNTVSNSVAKLVNRVILQMKAHFFDPKEPISIIGFLATFKLASDTRKIHKGTAM